MKVVTLVTLLTLADFMKTLKTKAVTVVTHVTHFLNTSRAERYLSTMFQTCCTCFLMYQHEYLLIDQENGSHDLGNCCGFKTYPLIYAQHKRRKCLKK